MLGYFFDFKGIKLITGSSSHTSYENEIVYYASYPKNRCVCYASRTIAVGNQVFLRGCWHGQRGTFCASRGLRVAVHGDTSKKTLDVKFVTLKKEPGSRVFILTGQGCRHGLRHLFVGEGS